jgi:hypothetical protein
MVDPLSLDERKSRIVLACEDVVDDSEIRKKPEGIDPPSKSYDEKNANIADVATKAKPSLSPGKSLDLPCKPPQRQRANWSM